MKPILANFFIIFDQIWIVFLMATKRRRLLAKSPVETRAPGSTLLDHCVNGHLGNLSILLSRASTDTNRPYELTVDEER